MRDTNESAQMQIALAAQPELRLVSATIARIGDLTQKAAVRFGLFVGDDGQATLGAPVDIGRHGLRRLAIDANDPAAQRIAALIDRDDAVAVLGRPCAERSATVRAARQSR